MFFPSPTGIIKRNIYETLGKPIANTDYNVEASLINTYGDGFDYLEDLDEGYIKKSIRTPEIVIGKKLPFEFIEFLSNHGKTTHLVRFKKGVSGVVEHVDFNFLQGKYVLICCFNVPILAFDADHCRAVIEAYDELLQNGIPFEMVVVAKMRSDVSYDQEPAFDHFCSAFSCLGIPFSDFETRAFINSSISCGLGRDSAILVDPKGIILQDTWALPHFFYYSSDWFPFLDATLNAIQFKDEVLKSKLDPMSVLLSPFAKDIVEGNDHRPLSLAEDILQCDPSLKLSRLDADAETDADVFSTVLDLSRKYVGLYLCVNGSIMGEIKAAHDNCLANNLQLEIVLVCMSFYDEPTSYNKDLHDALRLLNIKSWFIFDYNSKSCRRLWRIFGNGSIYHGEKLIIIPPGCESGELCGREVIANFGIKEYPFTRTSILRRRLEYVKSLTPVFPSLFNSSSCLMIHNGQEFKSEQLQGKNVLLYLSWDARDLDSLLFKYYPDIKAKGWEVVFVPLEYAPRYWNGELVDDLVNNSPRLDLDKMPWPVIPPSAAAKAFIKEKLFFPEDKYTTYLFAVGKDGNIVSRDVRRRLKTDGLTESLFDDVLERNLAYVLAEMPLFENYD